jgi:hypothetical protein
MAGLPVAHAELKTLMVLPRRDAGHSLWSAWIAEPAQAQISLRVFLKVLEAQWAADCHHFTFYPEVGKTLAV